MNKYLLVILAILSIISLTLSIISLTKCKDHFGGEILNPNDCPVDDEKCRKNMEILSSNINSQYQGQPANRGITYPGGPEGGSFGNPDIIGTEGPDGPDGPDGPGSPDGPGDSDDYN